MAHAFTSAFGSGTILSSVDTLGNVSDLGIGGVGNEAEELSLANNAIAIRLSDGVAYVNNGNEVMLLDGGSASDAIALDSKFIYKVTNSASGSFLVEKVEKYSGAVIDSTTLAVGATEVKALAIHNDQLLLVLPNSLGMNLVQIDTNTLSITRNFFDPAITGTSRGASVDGEKCIIGCGFTDILSFRYRFEPSSWMVNDEALFNDRKVKCLS